MKYLLSVTCVALACWLCECGGATARCSSDSECDGGRCVDGSCVPLQDSDGDGIVDSDDNCPDLPNPDQADSDSDGLGDACDPCPRGNDTDSDGLCDGEDNCPQQPNPSQEDADGDGAGDACDACPADPANDADGDGVCGPQDNCPSSYNPDQEDADSDGLGDACDRCPFDPANDSDADGYCADADNCPEVNNPQQEDSDSDGEGDACDPDDESFREGDPADPSCSYQPPRADFQPAEEGGWSGSDVVPDKNQVMATPAVANLNDDNGDGLVDARDIPDIVFNSFDVSGDPPILGYGVLRAVSGNGTAELWTVDPSVARTAPASSPAVADLDGDGLVEIVTLRYQGGPVVFENDGTLKWSCADQGADNCVDYGQLHFGNEWGGPAIADLDRDGSPEIVLGAAVWRADGTLWWQGDAGLGDNGVGPLSVVCNLDRSGDPEVVTGSTAYASDGTILWDNGEPDGFPAIGNFDGDDYPEIVVVADGAIRLQEHDGSIAWGPNPLPGQGRGGPPTVADFDGDGRPEIGVADHDTYVVFDGDGSVLWAQPTQDHSSSATGSSVFDFEDDGYAEVVYNDETALRVYDGQTGTVLFEAVNSSFTAYEYPVIADVDNDGNAEIVVAANDFIYGQNHGIRIFGDVLDNWVRTRRIWNQHTYHITNVTEDGQVPADEEEGWLVYNSYRQNELGSGEGAATAAPDIVATEPGAGVAGCPGFIVLWAWISNRGAIDIGPGIPVSFWLGNPAAGGQLIGVARTTRKLEPGQAQRVMFTWTNPPAGEHSVVVIADSDGSGLGITTECSEDNNAATLDGVGCP
ncbi:MAG: hypothetical protein D6806_08445 [Deltaproteobacteria bacterium]|nr:MAG: hypothetical protein D6806_08445 [Deltaproteobacteria bacterium]